ncbi:MAG: hypothetical protein M3464_00865 [Chloroflexota bacterium]|nr:hypothetical protein [Chloroflexota bacterium]
MHYSPETLISEMEKLGYLVTKRRLLDWVQKGLLPHPRARGRGRGRGKVYEWTAPDVLHRAVDVYDLLAWHRRTSDLFLPLWVLGYEVPLTEVRAGLRQVIEGLDAGLDATIPRFGDRSDLVSDLLVTAQQQVQQDALPTPVLVAFLHAVVNPDAKHWARIVDDLKAALAANDGEPLGWPDVGGTTDLLSFVREQLSVPRLRGIIAATSDAELAQVHHDLRRVAQLARAVAHVGLDSDARLMTRVFVWIGIWGVMLDLALRHAGRSAMVDRWADQVVGACRQLLTNPRLRAELQQLRARGDVGTQTVRQEALGAQGRT